jgi:hypothetical protein
MFRSILGVAVALGLMVGCTDPQGGLFGEPENLGPDVPAIVSVTADDPDDGDVVLGVDDTLTVVFDTATNEPAVSSAAEIDGLVDFGAKVLGANYTGTWSNAATLVITIVGAAGGDLVPGDSIAIIADGVDDLTNAAGTGGASISSGVVAGDWGDIPAPEIVSIAAEDPDNGDVVLGVDDTLTIVFDIDTNEPGVGTTGQIDGLLDFGSQSLGTQYTGAWSDAMTLVITVTDATGGDLAIGATVTVIEDGAADLTNAAGTSFVSISAGTVTGDWGSTATPAIVSATADDPDNADDVLSSGDTLTIVFDRNTNIPAVATTADTDDLVDFGAQLLGTDYTGTWSDARTLVITVVDAATGDLLIGATVSIKDTGAAPLTNQSGTSAASTASATIVGDWGVIPAPEITSVVADDADDLDGVLSDGDALTISFDMDTNEVAVATKADIDGLVAFAAELLGADYTGAWSDPATLVITVVDAAGGTLDIGDAVSIRADGTNDLKNAAGDSVSSMSTGVVTGDWGVPAPSIVSITADDPGDGDDVLSNGDTLTIVFDMDTSEPAVNSTARVNGLLDFGASSLGAALVGAWTDARTLVITVNDATGGDLAVGGTVQIRADGTRDLFNAAGTSPASTSSGTVAGDWGDPAPSIVSVVASDPDNGDLVLSNGDTLTMAFDRDTNQPAAATKTEIDGLMDLGGSSLGDGYTGAWSDARTLVITVTDATNGNLAVSDTITVIADGVVDLTNAAGTSAPSTDSANVTGDWGNVTPPNMASATARDPDNGDDVLSDGDTLTLVFDRDTNQPAAATKAEIDGLVDFGGSSLGDGYTGAWSDARTLVITVTDATNGNLAIGDTITIIAEGTADLTNTAGTSAASTDSASVAGAWGVPGPAVASITAADASASGAGIQAGDTLRIVFDVDTNEPAAATKAEIDGLIGFGAGSLGTDYTGSWTDAQSLLITVVNAGGATLAIGGAVTVIADGVADLTDAAGTTGASIDSGLVEGDWGLAEAPAMLSAFAADFTIPQAGLNNNDRLTITFNMNTNQPAAANTAQIDGLVDFGGKSLGAAYSGTWLDAQTLEIVVNDATGGDLAVGDVIRIIADAVADLTNQAGTSPASTAGCTVSGDWSVVP